MAKTANDLSRLLMEVRRPYLGPNGRDETWDRRRDLRHRRREPWTPSDFGLDKAQVKYKDLTPEFVVNKLKSRLGANDFKYAIKVPGDAGPVLRRKGENIEDFVRGAWDMLDPIGEKDGRSREHLAADGLSCLEFEILPHFTPPQRQDEDDEEYDNLVERFRQENGLPVRLLAPDPRSLYTPTGDVMDVVFKVSNRPLIDVMYNWSASGFVLKAALDSSGSGGKGKLEQIPFLAGEQSPALSPSDYGQMVRLVRAADKDFIYDLAYSAVAPAGPSAGFAFGDRPGEVPDLILLGRYRNPFGRVPFFFATARRTADPDPAYRDYPLAYELIEMAEYINQQTTVRQMRGVMEALKPVHYQPHPDETVATTDNGGPSHIPKLWKPGFIRARGEFNDIPTPTVPDFDKYSIDLKATQQGFHQGLTSMLAAGQLGRASAAWMALQANEEVIAFLQEAMDSRANQRREASECLLKYCEERAEAGPITVRVARRSRQQPQGNIDVVHKMTAPDFRIPYRLEVTLDAMTQSQRAARVEYGRRLYEEGSISEETYLEEYVGIDDVLQEQARKDRETVMKPLRQAALYMGLQKASNEWYALVGDPILPVLQACQMPAPTNKPPEPQVPTPEGGQQGEAGSLARGPGSPGQGMGLTQPEPTKSISQFGNNGGQGQA